MIERAGAFVRVRGVCWRAVARGREGSALEGTAGAGRYNRPSERALYMSGSRAGVVAAVARYGAVERVLVRVAVDADGLLDLRDKAACANFGIDPAQAAEDWVTARERGEEPPSWAVADQVRATGAAGLVDPSRRAPELWHLVLFRWTPGVEVKVV